MRNTTAITHCALSCCVMWGIMFGFLLGSLLVLLGNSHTYVTPEMHGGGRTGFLRAVDDAVRERKLLRAPFTYDLDSWDIPSNLHAEVHRLPGARLRVLNSANVLVTIREIGSLNVSNILNSSLTISEKGATCHVTGTCFDTTLDVSCDTVDLHGVDLRQSRLTLSGDVSFAESLLSINTDLAAMDARVDVFGRVALIDTTCNMSAAACLNLSSTAAYTKDFSCS